MVIFIISLKEVITFESKFELLKYCTIIVSQKFTNGKRGVCFKHVFQRRRHYCVAFIKSSQAFASHLTKEISVKINQENIYSRGLDLNMKFVSKLFFSKTCKFKGFCNPKRLWLCAL